MPRAVWLRGMREQYAAREGDFEDHAYESLGDWTEFSGLDALPSELPRRKTTYGEDVYITNLDNEVFTINYGIHRKLGNIPHVRRLWLRAVAESIYLHKSTICPGLCPEEHMDAPALLLRQKEREMDYDFFPVRPRTRLRDAWKVFLTRVLAGAVMEHRHEIVRLGRESGVASRVVSLPRPSPSPPSPRAARASTRSARSRATPALVAAWAVSGPGSSMRSGPVIAPRRSSSAPCRTGRDHVLVRRRARQPRPCGRRQGRLGSRRLGPRTGPTRLPDGRPLALQGSLRRRVTRFASVAPVFLSGVE